MATRAEIATSFHRLHHGPELLRLANAWDAGSARLIESLGAKAVATTSAGVAWSHGYPDGDALPVPLLVQTVASIARVIRVPLTVDAEGGYADEPAAVGSNIAALIEAGASGINIEDGAGAPDLLCAKIEAAKRAGARHGIDLFVNARTDVYLRNLRPAPERVAEVIARAKRYAAAGADGIFVPGLTAPEEIREIVAAIDRPLNLLAWPGLPDAGTLAQLGVRRLSAGSGIVQGLYGRAAAGADAFLRDGRSGPLGEGAMAYGEINALFAPR